MPCDASRVDFVSTVKDDTSVVATTKVQIDSEKPPTWISLSHMMRRTKVMTVLVNVNG